MAPLVGIVTVNWNRWPDTVECLQSLERQTYPNFRIFLVDNGSTDGSAEILRRSFPRITMVLSRENVGFAAGFNRGIRRALQEECAYVLILNNDTIADAGMLQELVLAAGPDFALTAPLIFFHHQPKRIWSAGGRCHPVTLEMTDRYPRSLEGKNPLDPLPREYLTGCALLMDRDLFTRVGFFDERFFLYYEDMDYCLRVRRQGYRLRLVPKAKLWHKVSVSSGGAGSVEERYYMAQSSVLFFRKHVRGLQWPVVMVWRLAAAVRITIRLLFTPQGWSKVKAYWWGLWAGLTDGHKPKTYEPPCLKG